MPSGEKTIERWNKTKAGGGPAPSLRQIMAWLDQAEKVERGEAEVLDATATKTKVEDYFRSCLGTKTDPDTGQTVTVWKIAPSKTGLALALGISVWTLTACVKGTYKAGKPYDAASRIGGKRAIAVDAFPVLRAAYQVVTAFYEGRLSAPTNPSGSIFWLLNSGGDGTWTNDHKVTLRAEAPVSGYNRIAELEKLGLPVPEDLRLENTLTAADVIEGDTGDADLLEADTTDEFPD